MLSETARAGSVQTEQALSLAHAARRPDLTPMPNFDPATAARLHGTATSADRELDLRGASPALAHAAIAAALADTPREPTSLLVRISPATPTSGETLFQPVARQLLTARRDGLVLNFAPLPPDAGAGFHVQLPGLRERAA